MIMIRTRAIKFLLREAGFSSQVHLAEALDMDKNWLNRVINNRTDGPPSLTTVDRLCAALNCQPGDILEYQAAP